MSKIYNDSKIFCTYSDSNDLNDITFNSIHPLADLYFCPLCQVHKTSSNCFYNIESKFCSNCLSDYSKHSNDTTYCVKNCFECPECASLLTIKVDDHEINKIQGKSFKFLCVFCPYMYQSEVITSPKSLHSIVRSEKKVDKYEELYNNAMASLLDRYKEKFEWKKVDEVTLKNLALSVKPRSEESNIASADMTTYPLAKKLSVKKSLRCLSCNSYLFLPHNEPDQAPTVTKFLVKFNAVDYMPLVKLSLPILRRISHKASSPPKAFKSGNQYNFLLSVMSPLNQDLNIQISCLPTIPKYFISKLGAPYGTPFLSEFDISLTLPVSQFIIKSNPMHAKNSIKSIPTSFLTSKTTIARSELVLRLGNKLLKNDEPAVDYNNIENLESLVESGNNWYQVPINLLIGENENLPIGKYNIQIPLYITVNSVLPDSIKKLKLSKNELSFGYWNVLNLGEYTFVQLSVAKLESRIKVDQTTI